jgi:2'-hydroxyisoflavone reductase
VGRSLFLNRMQDIPFFLSILINIFEKRRGMMKVLILGGTRFLGKHITQAALRQGYEVSLFNRGNSNEAVKDVEVLLGDRDGTLDALKGRKWDAVIDTCGFVPRTVSKAAKILGENIEHYTYISIIKLVLIWN